MADAMETIKKGRIINKVNILLRSKKEIMPHAINNEQTLARYQRSKLGLIVINNDK